MDNKAMAAVIDTIAAIAKDLADAEKLMNEAGIMTHGIESVECAGRSCRYVNLGDPYDLTIIDTGSGPDVGSWGGWYEDTEARHCEEESETRCGYCGEFTPLCEDAQNEPAGAKYSWRNTRCEHCGHNVADGTLMPEPAHDED